MSKKTINPRPAIKIKKLEIKQDENVIGKRLMKIDLKEVSLMVAMNNKLLFQIQAECVKIIDRGEKESKNTNRTN